jgi:hypothetical protein
MESSLQHLNFHPSIASEAKVHSDNHARAVAHAAMKDIPGATEKINAHFSRSAWKIPYSIAPKPVVNLPYYMAW